MAGRPRKAIGDLKRLYSKDPDMVLKWLRKTGDWWFDIEVYRFMEDWINGMEKRTYQKVKAVVDEAVEEFLESETPDNVIYLEERRSNNAC